MAISETHLKDNDEIPSYFGYNWEGDNNTAARGSKGVGLLIKNGIDYKRNEVNRDYFGRGRAIQIEINNI